MRSITVFVPLIPLNTLCTQCGFQVRPTVRPWHQLCPGMFCFGSSTCLAPVVPSGRARVGPLPHLLEPVLEGF